MGNYFTDNTASPDSDSSSGGGNYFTDNIALDSGVTAGKESPLRIDVAKDRDIRAAAVGFGSGATFGALPALAGLQEAGKEANAPMAGVASEAPGMEAFGLALAKLRAGDPAAIQAYHMGRRSVVEQQNQAWQNDPWMYAAGNIGGILAAAPGGAPAAGATLPERLIAGGVSGAAGGALYGAGTTVGEGGSAEDVAKNAVMGGTIGAAGGVAAPALVAGAQAAGHGLSSLYNKATQPIQALRNLDKTAAGKIANALQYDAQTGKVVAPEDIVAARNAGQPVGTIDFGGEATKALGRSAANTSPGARSALEGLIKPRFEKQTERVANFVRGMAPVQANAAKTREMIGGIASGVNPVAYGKAYEAGDRPIWSPELERLTSSPSVANAVRGAITRWRDFQVRDKFGALNPPLRVTADGRLESTGGQGIPPYPNLQLWDYARRQLSIASENAKGKFGEATTESMLQGDLARQLNEALDKEVPEYADARAGAAKFFGAKDALEAGQKFLTSDLNQAKIGYAKFSPAEKELFAEGFVSQLVDRVQKIGDNRSLTIDRIFRSIDGRERINMALGPQRAGELEAFLRRENMLDSARTAIQSNSTTLRQMIEHGLAGGLAGGGIEGLAGGDWKDPKALIIGAAAGIFGPKIVKINENVSRRVGEMLASDDPKVWRQVLQMASRSPAVADTVRRTESTLEKLARPIRATPFEQGGQDEGQQPGQ